MALNTQLANATVNDKGNHIIGQPAELMNLRDNMSGVELDKIYIMRQELDRRRLFMIRARAVLLL